MIEIKDLHPLAIWTYWLWANRYESTTKSSQMFDNLEDMNSLKYQYEKWQNFIDTSFIYAGGQTMRFLWEFMKIIPRDTIYISTKVESYIEKPEDIEKQLDLYLSLMGIEYVDSYLMHAPNVSKISINETYYYMQKLITKGKVRYLWASNLSIDQLKVLHKDFDIKTFEWLYNIECKINEDVGIMQYCKENNIYFICYQSLRRNRIAAHNYPILMDLSNKYNKTQNQILLNRIIKEKNISALVKVSDINKAKENLESLEFQMDIKDIEKLNTFRNKDFDNLEVDRTAKNGIPIRKLANQIN